MLRVSSFGEILGRCPCVERHGLKRLLIGEVNRERDASALGSQRDTPNVVSTLSLSLFPSLSPHGGDPRSPHSHPGWCILVGRASLRPAAWRTNGHRLDGPPQRANTVVLHHGDVRARHREHPEFRTNRRARKGFIQRWEYRGVALRDLRQSNIGRCVSARRRCLPAGRLVPEGRCERITNDAVPFGPLCQRRFGHLGI